MAAVVGFRPISPVEPKVSPPPTPDAGRLTRVQADEDQTHRVRRLLSKIFCYSKEISNPIPQQVEAKFSLTSLLQNVVASVGDKQWIKGISLKGSIVKWLFCGGVGIPVDLDLCLEIGDPRSDKQKPIPKEFWEEIRNQLLQAFAETIDFKDPKILKRFGLESCRCSKPGDTDQNILISVKLKGDVQKLDIDCEMFRENHCRSSWDCLRLKISAEELAKFAENPKHEIVAHFEAQDGYTCDAAAESWKKEQYWVQPSRIKKIREGLSFHVLQLTRGRLPQGLETEAGFYEGFCAQGKEGFEVALEHYMEQHCSKGDARRKVLFLLNYHACLVRCGGASKEIEEILSRLVLKQLGIQESIPSFLNLSQAYLFLLSEKRVEHNGLDLVEVEGGYLFTKTPLGAIQDILQQVNPSIHKLAQMFPCEEEDAASFITNRAQAFLAPPKPKRVSPKESLKNFIQVYMAAAEYTSAMVKQLLPLLKECETLNEEERAAFQELIRRLWSYQEVYTVIVDLPMISEADKISMGKKLMGKLLAEDSYSKACSVYKALSSVNKAEPGKVFEGLSELLRHAKTAQDLSSFLKCFKAFCRHSDGHTLMCKQKALLVLVFQKIPSAFSTFHAWLKVEDPQWIMEQPDLFIPYLRALNQINQREALIFYLAIENQVSKETFGALFEAFLELPLFSREMDAPLRRGMTLCPAQKKRVIEKLEKASAFAAFFGELQEPNKLPERPLKGEYAKLMTALSVCFKRDLSKPEPLFEETSRLWVKIKAFLMKEGTREDLEILERDLMAHGKNVLKFFTHKFPQNPVLKEHWCQIQMMRFEISLIPAFRMIEGEGLQKASKEERARILKKIEAEIRRLLKEAPSGGGLSILDGMKIWSSSLSTCLILVATLEGSLQDWALGREMLESLEGAEYFKSAFFEILFAATVEAYQKYPTDKLFTFAGFLLLGPPAQDVLTDWNLSPFDFYDQLLILLHHFTQHHASDMAQVPQGQQQLAVNISRLLFGLSKIGNLCDAQGWMGTLSQEKKRRVLACAKKVYAKEADKREEELTKEQLPLTKQTLEMVVYGFMTMSAEAPEGSKQRVTSLIQGIAYTHRLFELPGREKMFRMADLYLKLGHVVKAVHYFEMGMQEARDLATPEEFMRLGELYAFAADHKKVIKWMQAGLTVKAKERHITATQYQHLAHAYCVFCDHQKALQYYEKTLELNPKAEKVPYYYLGETSFRNGDYARASTYFRKAIDAKDVVEESCYRLSLSKAHEKLWEEAEKYLKLALVQKLTNPSVKIAAFVEIYQETKAGKKRLPGMIKSFSEIFKSKPEILEALQKTKT